MGRVCKPVHLGLLSSLLNAPYNSMDITRQGPGIFFNLFKYINFFGIEINVVVFNKSTIIALSLYIIFLHCLPMWSRAHSQVICIDIPPGPDALACRPAFGRAFGRPFGLLSGL